MTLINLILCLLIADFISGFVHWAEDTYLYPTRSYLFNKYVVSPNLEHHKLPYSIWKGTYWETNGVSIVLSIIGIIGLLLFSVYVWEPFIILLLLSHSNQVHKWEHSPRPRIIGLMQGWLLQSPKHHLLHHKRPFTTRYCVWTNYLNPILDGIGFWRTLELVISLFGIKVKRGTVLRDGY